MFSPWGQKPRTGPDLYIYINIVGPLYFSLVLGLQNFSTGPVHLHLFLGSDVVSRQQDTCLISPFAHTQTWRTR